MLLFGNRTWTSPYVLSCLVALREKGLSFEVKTVALDRGELIPADAGPTGHSVAAKVSRYADAQWKRPASKSS